MGINDEILSQIGLLVPFRGLDPDVLTGLFADARTERHAKGTMLWQTGDEVDFFCLVLSGRVELFVSGTRGEESVIDVYGAGESLGLAYIFDQEAHNASARIIEDSRVISVSGVTFRDHVAANPDVMYSMMAGLSTRLRFLVHQVTDLKLKTTGQRLGSFLLRLTDGQTRSAVVKLPYDKKLLARRLAMKPESLSRAFGKLREMGVSSRGSSVTVGDIAVLREFCHDEEE